jgi:transcriptional regulator with XRE-family HTH domain
MDLRKYRKRHALTQIQLSQLLGVSRIAIAKREQANTVPLPMRIALIWLEHDLTLYSFDSCLESITSKLKEQDRRFPS